VRSNSREATIDTGSRFANALVEKRYGDASSMLTVDLKKSWSEEKLRSQYEEMISYGSGPVKVDGHTEFLEEWPDRKPGDVGWAYISISGSDFAEAITVVVAEENGEPKIRDLQWGRP